MKLSAGVGKALRVDLKSFMSVHELFISGCKNIKADWKKFWQSGQDLRKKIEETDMFRLTGTDKNTLCT